MLIQVHKPVEEKAHLCHYYTQLLINQSNMQRDNLIHMLKCPQYEGNKPQVQA